MPTIKANTPESINLMTTKYQRQWTELEAIKSIYEKEFEELKFPWKVDHPPWFRINFNAVGMAIEIRMTKTYPDGPPEIKVSRIESGEGNNDIIVTKEQAEDLSSKLKKEAEGLVGGEMCFDLIEIAREFAEGLQKRGKTSFHTEMLQRQEERDRKALDLQAARQLKCEEALLKQKKAEMEELEKKIREELKDKLIVKEKADDVKSTSGVFKFEPPIVVDEFEIKTVKSVNNASVSCQFGKSLRVVSTEGNLEFDLKIVPLSHPFLQTFGGRRRLELLLKNLKSHAMAKNENVLRCFGGQIDKEAGEMLLLCERDSDNAIGLASVLEQAGCLAYNRIVEYLKQLCIGLAKIHGIGLTHRCLDLESVLIYEKRRVKISDYLTRRCLSDLAKEHGIAFDNTFVYKEPVWQAPEMLSRPNIHGKKVDIWCLGRIAVQMLFGAESLGCWPRGFDDFKGSAEWNGLSEEMQEFLTACLEGEAEKRLSADELLQNSKLFTVPAIDTVVKSTKIASPVITIPVTQSKVNNTASTGMSTSSRYLTDFEELEFLGRGGFGSVVKVRNKIDDRFYAVKKIALDPRDVEYNKKILREVTTLSRLHHERIIRYYQAWIEDAGGSDDGSDADDSEYTTESATGFTVDKSPLDLSLGPKSFKPFSGLESEFDDDDFGNESTGDYDDFVQFESASTNDSESTSTTSSTTKTSSTRASYAKQTKKSQVLYIQMEYCPNQTLRDLIDERNIDGSGHFLDAAEIWRLFRQIVEGLVHIHAQGMMHRDLKPSNIFLDSNGDVKIGDFGLAVTRLESTILRSDSPAQHNIIHNQNNQSRKSTMSYTGESHTQNIGTPFYVSPEQITSTLAANVRYNQKVDMYSLGIILVELWVPFQTGMERVQCLQKCRLPEVILPKMDEPVLEIAKRLLCHDPKKRFGSLELLRSDLLPPMLEEELMEDAMRSVAQPGAPHFPRLISTIFRRLNDLDPCQLRVKDFAFDVHSGNATELEPIEELARVKKEMEKVFLRYGAVEINPPLLYVPLNNSSQSSSSSYTVLDEAGQRLELPGNLTRPFARWVAQSSLQLRGDLKRFAFDRVFRKISQVSSGQPFQPAEANFDLVHVSETGSSLAVCEVVRVLFDALGSFCKAENLIFKFNHLSVREKLIGKSNSFDLPVGIAGPSVLRVPTGLLDEKLMKILSMKDFETLINALGGFFTDLKSLVTEISKLHNLLMKIAIPGKVKVIFDPLLAGPRPDLYANDFCFVLLREAKHNCEVLACGGRYDQLIEEYKFPTARLEGKGPFAVGTSIFLDKLQMQHNLNAKKKMFVINLAGEEASGDELLLIGEMWRLGRAGQLLINRANNTVNITNCVTMQMKSSSGNRMVRIKRGREVEEVSIEELGARLKFFEQSDGSGVFSDTGEDVTPEDNTYNNTTTTHNEPLGEVHYLLSNDGNRKLERNSILREKAVKAFKVVNPAKCEIVIHELPRDVLKRFLHADNTLTTTSVSKKMAEEWRDQLTKLSNLMNGKLIGKMLLFVNHKDTTLIEAFFNASNSNKQ